MTKHAVIIGAGIAGLAAAIALRREGWSAEIFEQAPGLAEVGAGIVLSPNATRVLDELGVLAPLLELGAALRCGELRTAGGKLLTATEFGSLGATLAVHRADLRHTLLAALPAGIVVNGERCVSAQSSLEAAAARLESGRTAQGEVVLGADGLRSTVRQALQLPGEPIYRGYVAWRGVCENSGDLTTPAVTVEQWGRGLRTGLVPIGRDRLYWYSTANASVTDAAIIRGKEELLARFAQFGEPFLSAVNRTKNVIQTPIYDREPSLPWSDGRRIVLTGDAAHPTTPNLGQGACMAIEDALTLARLLSRNPLSEAIREFERRRFPKCRDVVIQSRRIGAVGQWSNPIGVLARDALLRLTPAGLMRRRMEKLSH